MKTLGQIACEAYYGRFDDDIWKDTLDFARDKWERAAKAVVMALESLEPSFEKACDPKLTPEGTESSFYFACRTPYAIDTGCLAKVVE